MHVDVIVYYATMRLNLTDGLLGIARLNAGQYKGIKAVQDSTPIFTRGWSILAHTIMTRCKHVGMLQLMPSSWFIPDIKLPIL